MQPTQAMSNKTFSKDQHKDRQTMLTINQKMNTPYNLASKVVPKRRNHLVTMVLYNMMERTPDTVYTHFKSICD